MLPALAFHPRRREFLLVATAAAVGLVAGVLAAPAPQAPVPRLVGVPVVIAGPERAIPMPVLVADPVTPTEPTPRRGLWVEPVRGALIGARGAGKTVIAWTADHVLVSRSDGARFESALYGDGPVTGADVAADGTVFAAFGAELGVATAGGELTWRTLPFEASEVFVDGGWLGIQLGRSLALSADQGRTWKHFSIDGDPDEARAAVVGKTLFTSGGRWADGGEESTIERRRLDGRSLGSTVLSHAEVVGLGHDGAAYTMCAGNSCSDIEFDGKDIEQVARGPGATFGVRDASLLSLRGGHQKVRAEDVPGGFVLTGADGKGRALGIDPARGVVRWSPAEGWRLLLPS